MSPLFWTLPSALNDSSTIEQIQQWHLAIRKDQKRKSTAQAVMVAVEHINSARMDFESAFIALGAAHTIRSICDSVDEDAWYQTAARLFQITLESGVDYKQQPWLYQLCEVELALTLSLELEELPKSKKLGKNGIEKMAKLVEDILDGDGWPKSEFLCVYGPLMASWTRCVAIAIRLKLKIPADTAERLEWAVRQTIRLARPDGTLMGSDHESFPLTMAFIRTMLRMTSGNIDQNIAASCLRSAPKPNRRLRRIPEESSQSHWGRVGAFRTHWRRKAGKVAFAYGDAQNWIEICRNVSLIEGDCTPQVSLNGEPLRGEGEFETICEHFDREIAYLELELTLSHGVLLQRQIILGQSDQFVIIADVICSPESARLDYRCRFPLAPGIQVLPETETREFYLRDKKIRSLVLPLALPEWKVAQTDDSLVCENNQLVLSQNIFGKGLFAGLFFDLNPKRSVKPRTWRQLTVAEMLRIVDKDVAVAFRIQIGKDHWVLYRTIGPKGNRTFLGENYADDFYLGRFDDNGEISELLQIE